MTKESEILLAIIVPAFKGRFLETALASIAAQTDQRFRLYVCDDDSPEDLRAIYERSPRAAFTSFVRFEGNLGKQSPVKSWARAVMLSSEPWVWVFSDDDTMDKGCVAAFYEALKIDGSNAANVYRFDTLIIDREDRVKSINPPRPERESVEEFIYHRITGQSITYMPDHLFRRSAYDECKGFVEFPHAFGSDDASWIVFAGKNGYLRTVKGPRVCWRSSGVNISSLWNGPDLSGKLLGLLEYAAWLLTRSGKDPFLGESRKPAFIMDDLVRDWFRNLLRRPPYPYSGREISCIAAAAPRLQISTASMRRLLLQINWQCRIRIFIHFVERHLIRSK